MIILVHNGIISPAAARGSAGMKKLAHFTIRQKLASGLALMFLSVLIISLYAIIQLNRLDRLITTALAVDAQILKGSESLLNALLVQAGNQKKFSITRDAAFKKLFADSVRESLGRLDALAALSDNSKTTDMIRETRAAYQRYADLAEREFAAPGTVTGPGGSQTLVDDLSARIRALNEAAQRSLDDTMLSSKKISEGGTGIALFITAFAILCGVAFGFIVTKAFYIPLQRLKQGTRDIAHGDFLKKIEISSADEIGDVSASFNQMCDRLRELDQLKTDFISNITHDLKTPLASITEANNLLAEGIGGSPSPEQQHLLAIIREDAARLLRLIESIIDISKMESGLLIYEFVPSDIPAVITEAIDAVRMLAERKKLTVAFVPDPGLPRAEIDRAKIVQGLINLLGNAIKFTPEHGSLRLSARAADGEPYAVTSKKLSADADSPAPEKKFLEITVADTGPGISAEDLPRIFDKFFQGRAGVQKRGSGLGLAIVRHIIEAHGGVIWAESAAAGGSVFHILLPFSHAAPSTGT